MAIIPHCAISNGTDGLKLTTQVHDLEEDKGKKGNRDLTGRQASLSLWADREPFKARPFTSPPAVVLGAEQLELGCKEKLVPCFPGHSVMARAGVWRFAFISLPPISELAGVKGRVFS